MSISAQLSIPCRSKGIDSLKWRVLLVDKEGIFPKDRLLTALKAPEMKTRKLYREVVDYACSEVVAIDELDQATLLVAQWALRADEITDDLLLFIDRRTRNLLQYALIDNKEEFLRGARLALKNYGNEMLRHEVRKIRARVALQEIAAMLDPEAMVPSLVSFSLEYLGCDFVQKWLLAQKREVHSDNAKSRTEALRNIRNVGASLVGDRRRIKKRKYAYWRLGMMYAEMKQSIQGFRTHTKKGTFNKEFFELYCEMHQIPSIYISAITNPNRPAGQLVLDIFVEQGLISDTKAFRDFQPTIGKIQKKHFQSRNVLGIALELSPLVFEVIDLPRTNPYLAAGYDPAWVLNRAHID